MKKLTKKLTKKQKADYLKNSNHCPYCGSRYIDADRLEVDVDSAWSIVTCESCGKFWKDVFTLTGIEEDLTQADDSGNPI